MKALITQASENNFFTSQKDWSLTPRSKSEIETTRISHSGVATIMARIIYILGQQYAKSQAREREVGSF